MKALKALVIGMGLLILLGLAVVIATLASRVKDDSGTAAKPESAETPAETPVARALNLPAGCRIAAMAPAGEDRLALRIAAKADAAPGADSDAEGDADGGTCARVLLIDPESGRVATTLHPHALPAARATPDSAKRAE